MSTSRFTLVFDESGSFEESRKARAADLIGGLLVPGGASSVAKTWSEKLQPIRAEFGDPLHANTLPVEQRHAAYAKLGPIARASGARWLFLIDPPSQDVSEYVPFARYMRMLDAYVDLAARLAAAWGATDIDVRPAQRTLTTLGRDDARHAADLGLARESGQVADGTLYRGITEADVRVTMGLLAQEGSYPALASVKVKSAEAHPNGQNPPHPGLSLADFGCNFVLGLAANRERMDDWPDLRDSVPLIVSWRHLPAIREVDLSLRETTPSLVRAGMAWARLAGDARLQPERWALRAEGAQRVAEELMSSQENALERGDQRSLARIAARLALESMRELDAKTGAYEGVWRALQNGWAGEGNLAKAIRSAVDDREVAGLLWRLTLECSNHRGDVASARKASDAFDAVAQRGISLALLTETLRVRNLWCVAIQNRLPAPEAEAETVMKELLESVEELQVVADEAGGLVTIAEKIVPGVGPGAERPDSSAVRADETLWAALGKGAPVWQGADRERGRCMGTAARGYAFAGRMDEAIDVALKARLCFGADSFDRGFNATVLCRILLERARLTGGKDLRGLAEAWAIAGMDALHDPQQAIAAVMADRSVRFRIDVLLRGLLWAGTVPGAPVAGKWLKELNLGRNGTLFGVLSSGDYVSHPTELIARHAGELAQRDAARDWFELSLRQSEGSTGGTIRAFAEYTARLRDGKREPSGVAGSSGNPTFEYR